MRLRDCVRSVSGSKPFIEFLSRRVAVAFDPEFFSGYDGYCRSERRLTEMEFSGRTRADARV